MGHIINWHLRHQRDHINDNFGMEILDPDSDSQAGDGALTELSPLRNKILGLYKASFDDLLNLWCFYSITAPHYENYST